MRLYTFNGERFWCFDLERWGLPFTIDITKYYPADPNDFEDNTLNNNKLDSIFFRFSILCFHIDFWLEFKND